MAGKKGKREAMMAVGKRNLLSNNDIFFQYWCNVFSNGDDVGRKLNKEWYSSYQPIYFIILIVFNFIISILLYQ